MTRRVRPRRRPLSVARGWLLAVSSAALAASAHAAADGGMPDLPLMLPLTVLVGWVSTAIAHKAGDLVTIAATLSASQLLMHGMLTVAETNHGGTGAPIDGMTMTAAHAVATLLTALLVTHAERGLAAFAATLRRLLPVVLAPLPVRSAPSRRIVVRPAIDSAIDVLLTRICARRGPPLYS